MSEFEVILYYYFLEKNNWHYAGCLCCSKDFPDFLNFSDMKNVEEYKAIFLYLIFSAFYVKVKITKIIISAFI